MIYAQDFQLHIMKKKEEMGEELHYVNFSFVEYFKPLLVNVHFPKWKTL